jgi:hypothetical protein
MTEFEILAFIALPLGVAIFGWTASPRQGKASAQVESCASKGNEVADVEQLVRTPLAHFGGR